MTDQEVLIPPSNTDFGNGPIQETDPVLYQQPPPAFQPIALTVPKEYICQTCKGVCAEMHIMSSCLHRVCRRCLKGLAGRIIPCPRCGQAGQADLCEDLLDRATQTQICCPYASIDSEVPCHWIGYIADLEQHLDRQCLVKPTPCPFKAAGCPEVMPATRIQNHIRTCEFRPVVCQFCRKTFPACQLEGEEHLCPERLVPCPYGCGEKFPLAQLEKHVACEPRRPVPCPIPGCTYRMRVGEMAQHLQTLDHTSLIVNFTESTVDPALTAQIQGEIVSLTEEMDELDRAILEREEELKSLEERIIQLQAHDPTVPHQLLGDKKLMAIATVELLQNEIMVFSEKMTAELREKKRLIDDLKDEMMED